MESGGGKKIEGYSSTAKSRATLVAESTTFLINFSRKIKFIKSDQIKGID